MIRVMIADDQELIRESLQIVLDINEDMQVVGVAQNGAELLELLEKQAADVILMDVRMPVMDGIQFIKEVRKSLDHKFTPIIVLTTENQESKMQEGKEAGATGWIVKPFSSDKLIAVVKKIIG